MTSKKSDTDITAHGRSGSLNASSIPAATGSLRAAVRQKMNSQTKTSWISAAFVLSANGEGGARIRGRRRRRRLLGENKVILMGGKKLMMKEAMGIRDNRCKTMF